jgi:hypothetical protein
MEPSKIEKLAKCYTSSAIEVSEGFDQLDNYDSLLRLEFGTDSGTYTGWKSFHLSLIDFKPKLMEKRRSHPKIMPCLFQAIANLMELHLSACMNYTDGDPIPVLDLRLILNQLAIGSSFSDVHLDDIVHFTVLKHLREERGESGKKSYEKANEKKTRVKEEQSHATDPAVNSQAGELDVVVDRKLFHKVYGKNTKTIPHDGDDTELCANYHCQGKCKWGKNCRREKTHTRLTGATLDKFLKWVKKCKEAANV